MFRVFRLLLAAAIGAGLGLGSVWLMLNDPLFNFSTRLGPWEVSTGAATRDPYAAARAAREGATGLGSGEGVAFVAHTDSRGALLDPACHILVDGAIPEAALWTLTATDRTGKPPANPAGRIGYTSESVVAHGDGHVSIIFGPTARPGNFVDIAGLDGLILTLRVYSSAMASQLPLADDMPRITTVSCVRETTP